MNRSLIARKQSRCCKLRHLGNAELCSDMSRTVGNAINCTLCSNHTVYGAVCVDWMTSYSGRSHEGSFRSIEGHSARVQPLALSQHNSSKVMQLTGCDKVSSTAACTGKHLLRPCRALHGRSSLLSSLPARHIRKSSFRCVTQATSTLEQTQVWLIDHSCSLKPQ